MSSLAWIFLSATSAVLLAQVAPQPGSTVSVESLMRAHQYDQALEAAQAKLQQSPSDVRTWTLEAILYSMKGRDHEAEEAYEQALRVSPGYSAALKGEADLFYRHKDKRVMPLLTQILKADPRDVTAREMLAVTEERQGDCGAALGDFDATGDVFRAHTESLEAYGYCLMHLKQQEKAIPIFKQLAALLPDENYPKYDLAVLLVATKQYQAGLDALSPLLKEASPDADALSLAAEAYEALRDTPHAVPLLRQAIALKPTNADYYVSFATLCLDHDSFQIGVDMLNAGIARIPGNSALYIWRGLLYAQLAQYDKADDDFKTAEQFDHGNNLSAYVADLTELQRNRTKEAIPTIRAQVKAHPENALFQYLLAKTIIEQGAPPGSPALEEATRSAVEAVRLKPDLAPARDILAGIYISANKADLAIEQCRAALHYAPEDQTAIFHLIVALRHSGQTDEIQALAKRLSDLKQKSRKEEDELKRYRLVEQAAPSQ